MLNHQDAHAVRPGDTLPTRVTGLKAKVKELAEKLSSAIAHPPPTSEIRICEISDPDSISLPFHLEQLKTNFKSELNKMISDFKLQQELQIKENNRFKILIKNLKEETNGIHNQIIAAKKQLEKLEDEIGTG